MISNSVAYNSTGQYMIENLHLTITYHWYTKLHFTGCCWGYEKEMEALATAGWMLAYLRTRGWMMKNARRKIHPGTIHTIRHTTNAAAARIRIFIGMCFIPRNLDAEPPVVEVVPAVASSHTQDSTLDSGFHSAIVSSWSCGFRTSTQSRWRELQDGRSLHTKQQFRNQIFKYRLIWLTM